MSTKETLSPSQLDQYQTHISLPLAYQKSQNPPRNLEFLSVLLEHHISTFPYENLGLHYAKAPHSIPLDIQSLFAKAMNNGRGGYCMENAIFFNHVLKGLGFEDVYLTGARARPRVDGVPRGNYSGWMHVVNIVTLLSEDDQGKTVSTRYMVDVGFGGDLATKPLPLVEDHITQNIGTQELRLEYSSIPEMQATSQRLWIYQYRNSSDQPWNASFCFPDDTEFLHQDLEVMNFATSQDPRCFQTYTVLVVLFLRDDRQGVYGKLMLINGEIKQNLGGKTSLIRTCKSEEERVRALKELFGISLTESEVKGIRERVAELR